MNPIFLAFSAIVVAILSIQLGAVLAKQLFPIAGPIGITALRLLLAAGLLMVVWRPWREVLTRLQFKTVCLYGFALGFMNLCFYLSIARIPLGLAVTLEFSGPLCVAIFSSKRKIDFLWAGLAALGIVLISPFSGQSNVDLIGAIFALAAGVFWAMYIVMGQRAARIMHEGYATSYGMAMAAVAITPVVFFANGYANITLDIMPIAFLVALLSSAIPYSLEMLALNRLPKMTFGILMSLEPAIASITGLFFLKEQLSVIQTAAIILIIAASLGTTLAVTKPKVAF